MICGLFLPTDHVSTIIDLYRLMSDAILVLWYSDVTFKFAPRTHVRLYPRLVPGPASGLHSASPDHRHQKWDGGILFLCLEVNLS